MSGVIHSFFRLVFCIPRQVLLASSEMFLTCFHCSFTVSSSSLSCSSMLLKWWNRELTLKCKFKCYVKPMKDPLGVSPSKGDQGTTRGNEKLFWSRKTPSYSADWATGRSQEIGCLSIRAIHIEVVHSLDTDSFINTLRRFIARRGQQRRKFRKRGKGASRNGTGMESTQDPWVPLSKGHQVDL